MAPHRAPPHPGESTQRLVCIVEYNTYIFCMYLYCSWYVLWPVYTEVYNPCIHGSKNKKVKVKQSKQFIWTSAISGGSSSSSVLHTPPLRLECEKNYRRRCGSISSSEKGSISSTGNSFIPYGFKGQFWCKLCNLNPIEGQEISPGWLHTDILLCCTAPKSMVVLSDAIFQYKHWYHSTSISIQYTLNRTLREPFQ